MSQLDWSILLGAFTSLVLPFAHAWMKSNVLPDWLKFVIALTLSVVGGVLTVLVSGELVSTLSIVQTGALIASAGASIYAVAFRQFGLERVLFPRAYVITEAQNSVASQIGVMTSATIKDAVDRTSDTAISVQAMPVTYMGSETGPVQPKG
jgi:hypothetical protein